jgi:serine/threonine protein kinase
MEDAEIEDRFRAEYDLPCRPHPNIMRVLHHFCASVLPRGLPEWPPVGGQSSLFLVMQDYDCSLQSHCKKLHLRGSMDERFVLVILLQLLKAIEHLAKHNILHRDLKMDNVLIKMEKTVTRSDWSSLCFYLFNSALVLIGLSSVTLAAAMRLLSLCPKSVQGFFETVQVAIQLIILLSSAHSLVTPVLLLMSARLMSGQQVSWHMSW